MASQPNQQSVMATLTRVEGEEYLDSLDTLARELDRAMDAIAMRSLGSFEDSVARQLAVCGRLTSNSSRSVVHGAAGVEPTEAASVPMTCDDLDLAGRITEATATLVTLNRRYSALLKHSGDTIRLFAGVFRSYSGELQPQAALRAGTGVSTWSCEL